MEKIASFKVDHTVLEPGFYISRIDGDVKTYDLRMYKPNTGEHMNASSAHSFEHMFATYIRNSLIGDSVIYAGPMGCMTGFYLVVKDTYTDLFIFQIVKSVLTQIVNHEGDIFGKSEVECGNYKNLNLTLAKKEAMRYLEILREYRNYSFQYRRTAYDIVTNIPRLSLDKEDNDEIKR